jgi:hypothetical protein
MTPHSGHSKDQKAAVMSEGPALDPSSVIPSDLSFGYLSAELKSPVKIPIPTEGDAQNRGVALFFRRGSNRTMKGARAHDEDSTSGWCTKSAWRDGCRGSASPHFGPRDLRLIRDTDVAAFAGQLMEAGKSEALAFNAVSLLRRDCSTTIRRRVQRRLSAPLGVGTSNKSSALTRGRSRSRAHCSTLPLQKRRPSTPLGSPCCTRG